jgi:hypothetical protein
MPIQYPLIENTCLAASFAAALHMAGYQEASQELNSRLPNLTQGNELINNYINSVNRLKIKHSVYGMMMTLHKETAYNVLVDTTPASAIPAPASVVLQSLDGGITHAIAVYKDYIFDSSWPFALPRNADTLDWCCAPKGFFKCKRVYVLR